MKCKICRKEIKAPEIYWKSYDCCSACVKKAAKENKEEIEPNAFDENGNLIKIKWS